MGGFVIDNPYRGVTLAAVFPCLVPVGMTGDCDHPPHV